MADDTGSIPATFSALNAGINEQQCALLSSMNYLASNPSYMTPASFLMLQYDMMVMSQITEATSNLMAGINSMISTIIRNLKGG